LKRLFCLFLFAACSIAVRHSSPVSATGLYDEFPFFFSARDTSRTLVAVRQTGLDLAQGQASVLAGEVAFGLRPRYEVRIGLPFPAIRRSGTIVYGVGDMTLEGSARLLGDTLSTRGLFVRLDARFPTASEDFFPFSADSVALGGGLELRLRLPSISVRGAFVYTMARERRIGGVLVDGDHLTVAAAAGTALTPRTDVLVSGCFIRFDGGVSREILLLALRQRLSRNVELELDGALESGAAAARVFDEALSVALLYRFPPRTRPPVVQSGTP
jgi:hypothetical protein